MLRVRERPNAWPGFVDLFSNLSIIVIFLLLVFVFLWTATSVFDSKSKAKLIAQQKAEIAQMQTDESTASDLLVLAKNELIKIQAANQDLESSNMTVIAQKDELAQRLQESESVMHEMVAAYERKIYEMNAERETVARKISDLNVQIQSSKVMVTESAQRRSTLETEVAKLSRELQRVNEALAAAESQAQAASAEYMAMSDQLNRAMAEKLSEMSKYQSEFNKAIRMALGGRNSVNVEGDRFVVQSDILFPSGSYSLSAEGKRQIALISNVIKDMENLIPTETDWIIRVDGHTDNKKVIPGTPGYRNNVELSLLRARAVASEMAKNGVSRRRLVPSGMGETRPVDIGGDNNALQRNRRIELRLTNP